jgi:adenylate kinase
MYINLNKYHTYVNCRFADVIALIDADVIPLLKQCSLAGHAEFKTRHPLLLGNSMAVDILIDVLTDRGFSVAHAQENRLKPLRVNLTTGDVECEEEGVHAFRITFDKENGKSNNIQL